MESRKRSEDRIKSLSSDARKHYDLREGILLEEKKMLKTHLDDTVNKLKTEKQIRQVLCVPLSAAVGYVIPCHCMRVCVRVF